MTVRACAIVPSHNHGRTAGAVIARLRAAGLPVFLIDDGSSEPARAQLGNLSGPDVTLHRFEINQGKGAAVVQGLRMALAEGYTHALQVDADGQHDLDALPRMLELGHRHPEALITGQAVYDHSVPLGRALGRRITHFWVWVETLSFRIPDTMCGFRLYPLPAVSQLLESRPTLGRRMDFDTEIAVRLFWAGTPIASLPVKVIYPRDNTSNFRMIADNVRISRMHAKLVFTMLLRLPAILRNRPPALQAPGHWSWLAERGAYLGLLFLAAAYRGLGRRGCVTVMLPVVLYFYLRGGEQRRASQTFLERAYAAAGSERNPGFWTGYRHFVSFATGALDAFIAWTGGLPKNTLLVHDRQDLAEAERTTTGALFLVSHLGSIEVARALLDDETRQRLTLLVHTRHAENYNRLIRKFRPDAAFDVMQVSELGPESAIALKARIDAGRWVVIAGDRTPVTGLAHTSPAAFLGHAAPFSHGPYVLAALLDCPVYTLFCLREDRRYRLDVRKFSDGIRLPRSARSAALSENAVRYARVLEGYAINYPMQWYNFYDFWAGGDAPE
jgi:predicted LPLAT superfamily acyltransferase/glycosyltransferase involved in cell wall biosynthesis